MAKYNSVKGKLPKGGGKGLSGDALVGKVSQATIDSIKKMGMTEALKLAGKNGATAGGVAREFQEGVRRMYGAQRLAAAKSKYSGTATKTGTAKSADEARASANKPATKPTTKPAAKPASKSNTKSNIIKGTLGTAAAVGALVASKGKAAGLVGKLSPAVAGLTKSGVGKAIFGTGEKISTKAFSTTGRVAAKAGKPVSQTQYEAMQAAAKAKGIKPAVAKSADAARLTSTATKKKLAAGGAAASSAGLTKSTGKKK